MRMRGSHRALELGALILVGVLAWVLAAVATDAWLARARILDAVRAPDAETVRGLARTASLQFSLGVAALIAARELAHRRARDPIAVPWLLPAALGACLFGLVIHLATVEVARGVVLEPSGASFAQGVLIGCIAASALVAVPFDLAELARRMQVPLALAIAGTLLALAMAGSGPAGTETKINLGPLQPIELAKPLAIVVLAAVLGARAAKLRWQRRRWLGLRWPRIELLVPAVLALIATFAGMYVVGDLGPVLLLAMVFLGMFFLASRATGWIVLALALVALVLLVLGAWPELAGSGTVQTRLRMWQDPWTNGLSNGSQLAEGRWAIAAGGWTGQGLGAAAFPLVPAGKTDLVLATATEQVGLAGLVLYQLLVLSIVLAGCIVAARARTTERALLAGGAAILVLVQWLVIHAGTFGQLPLTGIVVPFVSAGRSSMIAFLAITAMIAKLAADGPPREPSAELAEVHAAARGVGIAASVLGALALLTGIQATVVSSHDVSARRIHVRLADGTRIARENPRLLALARQIRRGTIEDRTGEPIAISSADGARSYPLGPALGTLLGAHPTRVLLPPWALERQLDERLRGYADLRPFAPLLDLHGAAREGALAAIDGELATRSVRLSLDARLQADVAAVLARGAARHRAAAAVVLDVDTGHVLARAQVPDLDPGDASWQDQILRGDREALRRFRGAYGAWPDKTGVHGMFQAGSVGKLYTALAAVRTGHAGATYRCQERDAQGPLFTRPGWHKPIHDHHKDRPHGSVDLVEGIAVSCNVYFGQLGLELGPEPFAALSSAGVDAGFTAPLDPGPAGSRQLASTAFGQGALVMSAIQAARLVSAIASGGTYRRCPPTMELDAACEELRLADDPEALRPLIAGMRGVLTHGTGAALRTPPGVRVYGKTGTADVRGFRGEEPFGIRPAQVAPPHSWFVAFAEPASATEGAPAIHGRIAVAVVVPRGGSGASAAGPLAMQILDAAKQRGYLGEATGP